jgi:hypothetical protein
VGVGEDLAIGDDDAGAAQPGPDADDRRRNRCSEASQGLGQLVECGHVCGLLATEAVADVGELSVATCNILL